MKILRGLLILISLTLPSLCLSAAEYTYNQDKSKVLFTLKHLNIVTVSGWFKKFEGSFDFDPAKIEGSSVRLRIECASLDSGNKMRDRELRGKNFFWAEKYPLITFTSEAFKDVQGTSFNIYGNLTIRGKTVPVIFKTDMLTPKENAAPGKPIRFKTETFIHRKDFQLGTGNIFDPIMALTNEILRISLEVEGIPASA